MNNKQARLFFLSLILLVPLLVSGCWSRRDLNQSVIVAALGIDRGEDQKIKLTAQVVKASQFKNNSNGGSGGSSAVVIMTSSGNSFFDAVRNFLKQSGRKLYYTHDMAIVVGEKLARNGVLPVMDLLLRDHEFRLNTWFMVADGQAADIIKAKSSIDRIPAHNLDMLIDNSSELSEAVPTSVLESFNEIADESMQPVINRVELANQKNLLQGAGVFRRDKLIGWLDNIETRGYLWTQGKVKGGIILVACPDSKDQVIALEIKKSSGKIKPSLADGKLQYSIEVNVESSLGEQMCTDKLADQEMLNVLESEQRQAVAEEINAVIKAAQRKYKLDILGLGDATAREFPKKWQEIKKSWQTDFPNQEIQVVVKSKISDTGLTDMIKIDK